MDWRPARSKKSDFTDEERERFVELEREATKVEAIAGEGNLAATLLKMTDKEAEKHASEICSLFYDCLFELRAKDVRGLD